MRNGPTISPPLRPAGRRLRCLVLVGTRPEAIKMAPIAIGLSRRSEFETRLVLTGQHRELVDDVLDTFQLKADINLNLMRHSQTLAGFASRALNALHREFEKQKPDLILVQGDTTTAFIASLAAFYLNVTVGHVEAGLRTNNKRSPFPEEINRRLISVIADLHFAPTRESYETLLREGLNPATVYLTGNPVMDALRLTQDRGIHHARDEFPFLNADLKTILVTAHRRENHGEPLRQICRAVARLVESDPDVQVIWPVHPNPAVAGVVEEQLGRKERIHLVKPINYCSFVGILALCHLVLTDSGGVQEEAPAFGKPVLVLRDTTERPEGVAAGAARLIGPSEEAIVEHGTRLLQNEMEYQAMSKAVSPYGDGRAMERIVDAILYHYGFTTSPPEPYDPFREPALRAG
ncbi:MAG TPA: UDP-N-acetylglucosamine 2-epimerase (non-hydrolyzing) [bacterium]|nr:UDP-N-acetylglucosamine 2-epimerase (non-hydrolyzing) [bacterium]HXK92491.1 UDP-N-acetylglucosamine 2-epimerase (non-hydrolyzing) [bacterium]